MACRNGHASCLPPLIKAGADVDMISGESGHVPLHFAVFTEGDDPTLVEVLLAAGANAKARANGNDKLTPLHVASNLGHKKIVCAKNLLRPRRAAPQTTSRPPPLPWGSLALARRPIPAREQSPR